MLQLCKVTKALFISNARSACSDELIQQEAVTLCINVSKQQPFPSAAVKKLQVHVYDDPNEDLYSHFDRCGDAIQKEANRGGRTVVYCKNGRSRSATICIAYLMKHRKLTLTDAIQVSESFTAQKLRRILSSGAIMFFSAMFMNELNDMKSKQPSQV